MPAVHQDMLTIDGLGLETESHSWVFGLAQSIGLEQKLLDQLKPAAKYNTKLKLDAALSEITTHFPVQWGGACLLVDPQTLSFEGVYTLPAQKSIEARFLLGLTIGDIQPCTTGIEKKLDEMSRKLRQQELAAQQQKKH